LSDDDREVTPIEIGRFARVEHLLAVGQVERARELAVQEIASEPDDPRGYLSLARVHLYDGNPTAAVEAAAEAVRLAADWDVTWTVHASALFSAGRFAEAERSVIEAIRLDPEDGSLFQLYARVLSHCGRPKDALEFARRALELDPDDDSAHQLFASLLNRVHPSQWKMSEEVARRAMELNPDDPDSFAVLGAIVMTRGRYAEAESYFRSALEIDPHNQLALEGLAQVVMAKSWLYRPLLAYALATRRFGAGGQMLVVASLWAVVSLVNAAFIKSETGSSLLMGCYLAFCVYTWFAVPITRAILRRKYPWL
jgi:cytochrome c-type biogenesis protein CcmH/NrfG